MDILSLDGIYHEQSQLLILLELLSHEISHFMLIGNVQVDRHITQKFEPAQKNQMMVSFTIGLVAMVND
jgi:hypothetical protein